MGLFRRKKNPRYEYYGIEIREFYEYGHPQKAKNFGAWGNLGSQGWHYVGTVNGLYMFERVTYW